MFVLQPAKRVSYLSSSLYVFSALLSLSVLLCFGCATRKTRIMLAQNGIDGVSVAAEESGVLLTLDEGDILFGKDSAVLLPSETEKLEKLAAIIKLFDDQKLLIKGYTAFSGTKEGRRAVSERRARSVADYLINAGIKKREDIFIKTYGASNGADSNKTEEGRAKNRRVQVVVLDKGYKTEVQTEIEREAIRHVNGVGGTDGTLIRVGQFNTRFASDSFQLSDCEMIKLDKLAELIALFEDSYVMIKGHSALSGKRSVQWAFSAKRAHAVADYLISLGVKDKDQFIIKACGADEPLASNKSAAGKAQNRRVEIIILDRDYSEFEEDVDISDEDGGNEGEDEDVEADELEDAADGAIDDTDIYDEDEY
ncbi:OmpA family protein [Treponema lecithinolyticum]|uniref:OmpA family protein n=1 Tax=Treponema lecithinolyticum TaxID=53418 RepID=UPI0028E341B1|nr:OmpA family protein [Treponema lecithinolyticum]